MIDYAKPLILIEELSKIISDYCLDKRYDEAIDKCHELNRELLVLVANLSKMSDVR